MNDPAIQKDKGADRPGHRAAGVGDAVSIRKKSTDAKGNEEADRRRSAAKRSLLEMMGHSLSSFLEAKVASKKESKSEYLLSHNG